MDKLHKVEGPSDMVEVIKKHKIDLIDVCFTDPLGRWRHCHYAPSQVETSDIEKGFAFDGSSISLFTTVENSDMIMKPDSQTCWIDPFSSCNVLRVLCNVYTPEGIPCESCPRNIAQNAVKYMKERGFADTAIFGPEMEYFVFSSVKFNCSPQSVCYEVDTVEGAWNNSSDRDCHVFTTPANLAHRVHPKGYYLEGAPTDFYENLRSSTLLNLRDIGVPVEKHHHEVASSQHELGFTCQPLVECADTVMACKYIIKKTAHSNGLTASFMPKPIYGQNGSGMHCHQSLWKDGVNLFYSEEAQNTYLGFSTIGRFYLGGLLKHARALLAITNSTINSYKRLVAGFEAPVSLVYSKGNRSAAVRIPNYDLANPKSKRLEFRCPDAAGCPYIMFAAMLMAGLDGIKNKIEPPEPITTDLYKLTPQELAKIPRAPKSLGEALDALEEDNEFLLAGDVFSKTFLDAYIELKRAEIRACNDVPHPKEYEMYYHC